LHSQLLKIIAVEYWKENQSFLIQFSLSLDQRNVNLIPNK